MLQRVLATLLCLLGVAAIGLGVASATVWRPSDTLSASLRAADGVVATQPGVLELAADEVTIRARASSGEVVLAIGSADDVAAWVGTDPATWVSGLADRTSLASAPMPSPATPEPTDDPSSAAPTDTASPEPSPEPSATPDAEAPEVQTPAAPANPNGSDLWIAQAVGTPRAELAWTREAGRWSALAVATEGVPVTLTLTWPQVVTTPWRTPGIVVGSLLLLAGLAWWALLLLLRYRPHAVLGLVATADRWRSALPGQRATDPDAPALAKRRGDAATAEVEPVAGTADVTSGRRARRLRSAAAADAPPTEVPSGELPEVPSGEVSVEPGGEPVPLTRRALREQRERAERERVGRDAGQDAGPPAPGAEATPHGDEVTPQAVEATAQDAEPAAPERSAPERSALAARPVARTARRRLGFLRRRDAVPPEAQPEEAAPPEVEPPAAPAGPATNASADAWRRAWGLPSAGTTWGPAPDAAPAAPAAPDEAPDAPTPDSPATPEEER